MGNKRSINIIILILLSLLFIKCSDTYIEDKQWDYKSYFEKIMGDSLQIKFKEISLGPISREGKNNNGFYFFSYKRSSIIFLALNPDYSYEIGTVQNRNNDDSIWVDEVDEYANLKLDEVVKKFKEFRLRSIKMTHDNKYYIKFLIKNIKSNTLPFEREVYPWINDSTHANFVYSPDNSLDSTEYTVVRQLNADWFFSVDKPFSLDID